MAEHVRCTIHETIATALSLPLHPHTSRVVKSRASIDCAITRIAPHRSAIKPRLSQCARSIAPASAASRAISAVSPEPTVCFGPSAQLVSSTTRFLARSGSTCLSNGAHAWSQKQATGQLWKGRFGTASRELASSERAAGFRTDKHVDFGTRDPASWLPARVAVLAPPPSASAAPPLPLSPRHSHTHPAPPSHTDCCCAVRCLVPSCALTHALGTSLSPFRCPLPRITLSLADFGSKPILHLQWVSKSHCLSTIQVLLQRASTAQPALVALATVTQAHTFTADTDTYRPRDSVSPIPPFLLSLFASSSCFPLPSTSKVLAGIELLMDGLANTSRTGVLTIPGHHTGMLRCAPCP